MTYTEKHIKYFRKKLNNRKRNSGIRGELFLNSNEEKVLLASAKFASSKAIRSSMAMGITIKVIRGNEIIAISPDKSEKIVRALPSTKRDLSSLRKGMILERK